MTTLATFLQPDSIPIMENHTSLSPSYRDHHAERVGEDYSALTAKVITMIVLGVVSFIIGMVPVKIASWLRYKDSSKVTISGPDTEGKLQNHHQHHHHHHHHHHHGHNHDHQQQPALISLLLCYGGGVLLYTTFLHLQPEVREGAAELINEKKVPEWFINTELSLSDVLFCCGFFFVYFVEESVHWLLDRNSHEEEEEDEEAALHRTMSLRRCNKSHYRDLTSTTGGNIIPRATLSAPASNGHHVSKTDSNDGSANGSSSVSVSASTQGLLVRDQISVIDIKSADHSALDPQLRMFGGPLAIEEPIRDYKGEMDDDVSKHSRVVAKSFRGLLTVLALSFHAVFEGLAVGLEDSAPKVWYMFAAIATHKFVIAFCVGIGLVSSSTALPLIVVYIATFAMVTPLGIGLGITLSDHGGASEASLVSVVLQGMAAGTLLYVIFFEVLQRERNSSNQSGALQLAAILAGFCSMLLLHLLMGHEHHHGHSHGNSSDDNPVVYKLNYHHYEGDGHDHHGDHFHNHNHDHHDHEDGHQHHLHDSSAT